MCKNKYNNISQQNTSQQQKRNNNWCKTIESPSTTYNVPKYILNYGMLQIYTNFIPQTEFDNKRIQSISRKFYFELPDLKRNFMNWPTSHQ